MCRAALYSVNGLFGFGPRLLHLSVVEDIGHWALSQMVPGVLHCFLTFFQARKVARETRSRVG